VYVELDAGGSLALPRRSNNKPNQQAMTRIAFIACLFATALIGNVSAADSQVKYIATMTGVT
jgi:hypothetical protein